MVVVVVGGLQFVLWLDPEWLHQSVMCVRVCVWGGGRGTICALVRPQRGLHQ